MCEYKTAFNVNWFRIEIGARIRFATAYTLNLLLELANNVSDLSTVSVLLKGIRISKVQSKNQLENIFKWHFNTDGISSFVSNE